MDTTPTYGLTHLAVAVSDLEQTLEFYRDILDMQVMHHEKEFLQLTTPGCQDILVFEKKDTGTGPAGGIAHFGFRLRQAGDIGKIRSKISLKNK